MLRSWKALRLVALVAMLTALTAARASATPYVLSIESAGRITAASSGKIAFGTFPQVRCELTLAGTLERGPIEDFAGQQFGEVTEVRIGRCEGGEITAALGLPWRLTVNRLLGTLPESATGALFEIVGAALDFSDSGLSCLYGGTADTLMSLTRGGRTGSYTSGTMTAQREPALSLRSGSGLCPSSGSFAGTFTLSPAQTIEVAAGTATMSIRWEPGGGVERNCPAEFGTVNPGGISTRWLNMSNAGDVPLIVAAGSGVSGGFETDYSVEGMPAVGARIKPGRDLSPVKIRYQAPMGVSGPRNSLFTLNVTTDDDPRPISFSCELHAEVT